MNKLVSFMTVQQQVTEEQEEEEDDDNPYDMYSKSDPEVVKKSV